MLDTDPSPGPSAFPIVLPVAALADALEAHDMTAFRAAIADAVRRGGAELLDGDLVGLSAEAAERLRLQQDEDRWFIGKPVAEEKTTVDAPVCWRSGRHATEADNWAQDRQMEDMKAKLRRLCQKPKRRVKKPAKRKAAKVPARPVRNSFDLKALRRKLEGGA